MEPFTIDEIRRLNEWVDEEYVILLSERKNGYKSKKAEQIWESHYHKIALIKNIHHSSDLNNLFYEIQWLMDLGEWRF